MKLKILLMNEIDAGEVMLVCGNFVYDVIVHMNYVIEGRGALVNEKGDEQPLKAGDFALVNPDEKHQYRNKGDVPFKMICGVPKEFE